MPAKGSRKPKICCCGETNPDKFYVAQEFAKPVFQTTYVKNLALHPPNGGLTIQTK